MSRRQHEAERHIGAVISGLQEFSQDSAQPLTSATSAVDAMCAFLAKFDVTCLRAYLRGTTIPALERNQKTDVVLVSDYVQHLQKTSPERFQSLMVVVQGHMLANALLCPDLHEAPKSYERVTFYLDTPLIVQRLGLEGDAKQVAISELISLLIALGGRVAAFAHSREELHSVISGAASNLNSPKARGGIVVEARKRGTTRSDLVLLAESLDEKLDDIDIEILPTPRYIEQYQIDEMMFEEVLMDEVSYHNPRAREYDINSVRSIYTIRGSARVPSVEKSRALLVTSNTSFANAAWKYGKSHEQARDVSSVITDFSLANMAWLKAPMGALTIPRTQVLAFAYAALQPSPELLSRYMGEIERLEEAGVITERDHQLLRSSPLVYSELVHLTLGEDSSLTEETVTQTLERVTSQIKSEESAKLAREQEDHQDTQSTLAQERTRLVEERTSHAETRAEKQQMVEGLFWRCRRNARRLAGVASGIVAVVLVAGSLAVVGFPSSAPIAGWVISACFIALSVFALINLISGYSVRRLHEWISKRFLSWLIMREATAIGIDLEEFNIESSPDQNRSLSSRPDSVQ